MLSPTSQPNTATAAILWTGGKDSALALYEARRIGLQVGWLVTFAPPQPEFLAHPLAVMRLQAEALGLPHFVWPVSEPFAANYEEGLRWLQEKMGITTVVTGDIAEVGGQPNWIRERSRPVGMQVLTPLWGRNRRQLLEQLLAAEFEVVFSCVKKRWLAAGWAGRRLSADVIAELAVMRVENGLDLCGEEGEYHTLVLDSPDFQRRLHFAGVQVCEQETLAYLRIDQAELQSKP
ncbi:MAG TPA: diphthine--ammonia ligase [Verrucomicrobiae bacterium]